MRKIFFSSILLIFLFLTGLFLYANLVLAQELHQGNNVVLPADQTVNKDYFATGNTITLSGTVNGDTYLAGGNIIVDGTINGDLLVAGGAITIRGRVANDIRVVGGQIIVSGEVGNSVSLVGGAVTTTDSARIGGSITTAGGSVTVLGPVGRGMTAAAGQMTISNSVGDDLVATVGQAVLTSQARISGNFNYWSSAQAQVQPGAQVAGQIRRQTPPQLDVNRPDPQKIFGIISRTLFTIAIISFITYLIIGLLLLYFFPVFTKAVIETIRGKVWKSLGIGLLAIILTPIIAIILLISVIGIPLALILLIIYFIYLYLSPIFVSLLVGEAILRTDERKIAKGWALLLGLVIYMILTLIPLIGWLVMLLTSLFGLGALTLTTFDFYNKSREENRI